MSYNAIQEQLDQLAETNAGLVEMLGKIRAEINDLDFDGGAGVTPTGRDDRFWAACIDINDILQGHVSDTVKGVTSDVRD